MLKQNWVAEKKAMDENYYSLDVKEVLKSLKTSEKGLTKKEAEQRLDKYGINIETSGFLIGSVIISVLMQLAVLYTPLNVAFKIVPIGLFDWIKILLVSCTLYIILESRKMFMNYRETKS